MGKITNLLVWILCCIHQTAGQQKLLRVQKTEEMKAHCSTWGKSHFKSFDNSTFTFPGTCQYNFISHCQDSYSDFYITIRRVMAEDGNRLYFTFYISNIIIQINEDGLTVDGEEVVLPYNKGVVDLDDSCENFKVTTRTGIVLTWNWGDDLKVELDDTYKGKTCGLCGSYDDNASNDLSWNGVNVSPIMFGNLQKTNDPTEDCLDVPDIGNEDFVLHECQAQMTECKDLLSSMGNCKDVLGSYGDFLNTCKEDLCNCASDNKTTCICSTLNQFSKECVLAGGHPGSWRRPDLCFVICPRTMEFFECVSPCPGSCSNPAASTLCNEHCTEGCTCPLGTLLDDIRHQKECVKQAECPCVHSGKIYNPTESFSTACQNCICILGQWACTELPCSGTCSLKGGSHISTYDKKEYTFHGNCQYVVSKDIDERFAVLAKIDQCGASTMVTCLNSVFVNIGKVNIKICYCGNVYINNFLTLLPKIKAGIIIYKPSSYYINVVTPFGLSVLVQTKPVFQLFTTVNSTFKGKTIGLCGNFNDMEVDDLKTMSGVVEESVSAFSNSWKVHASCSDMPDHFEDPCAKSISRDEYAKHWCSLLINTTEIFATCHSYLDPTSYLKYCMYDVCNSENSEDSLCMWLSVYARDCALKGVPLWGWRKVICDPKDTCTETMEFSYNPRACNYSCRSLSEPDPLCNIPSTPTEGCTCPEGTYMTSIEKCVPPEKCPCIYKGREVPAGHSFTVDNVLCECVRGVLECPTEPSKVCNPPMYYVDCGKDPSAVGAECQKSCSTQDMQCYIKECRPGCVCPPGLVSNDKGICIPPSQCPCMHGGKFYKTGENITLPCSSCICYNRSWTCTDIPCPGICSVYGNGHYTTFDDSHFDFSGECDYVLSQDFCPQNKTEGSFRIITENIVCMDTKGICSLRIRVFFKNVTIELFQGKIEETSRESASKDDSYTVDIVGNYIVLKTNNGLTLMWDQKTTAIIQLSRAFEGAICGLCGNFDGRSSNDLTSSSNSLELNEKVFAESWKVKQGCKSKEKFESCLINPNKFPWAQKHCSLIKSTVFAPCHPKVDPIPFFDSCVSDSCSCTYGGDCECLCTSLAAYSAACRRHNICIAWRTPDICPLFCDYYNKDGHCEWHYMPCGAPCMMTCTNPMGKCDNQTEQLEGCYPVCSKEKPYFDENTRLCVPVLRCTTCEPGESLCDEESTKCLCCYNRQTYNFLQEISTINEGQPCVIGYCGDNGQVILSSDVCTLTYAVSTTTASTLQPKTNVTFEVTEKQTSEKGTSHLLTENTAKFIWSNATSPSSKYSPSKERSTLQITKEILQTASSELTVTSKTSVTGGTESNITTIREFTSTSLMEPNITSTKATSHRLSPYTKVFSESMLSEATLEAKTNVSSQATEMQTSEEGASRLLTVHTVSSAASHITRPESADCLMMTSQEYISMDDCTSKENITIHYCVGHCPTSARYTFDLQFMSRDCSCCMETKKSRQQVWLECDDGEMIERTYIHVEECSCVQIKCYEENDHSN